MNKLITTLAIIAGLGLSGCGNQSEPGLASQLGGRFVPALADTPDAAIEASAPTPETSMLFQVQGLGLVGLGTIAAQEGNRVTYLGDTGFSVTFVGPLMVATRGFGKDLMAAEAPGITAAIAARSGTITRRHEYLDSRDQSFVLTFECTFESKGTEEVDLGLRQVEARVIAENCRNERLIFENVYYEDSSGQIIASRQFISDVVAYLRNNRV